MNRRNFILGSTAAVGTLAAFRLSMPNSLKADTLKVKNLTGSVCEMCSSRCPIQVRSEDKKGVFIQGNPLYSTNKTSVCARGGAGINQLNDPQRLIKPLIRVGERGEGKWREATYEEAFNYAYEKLKSIKEKYGGKSVIFSSKSGNSFNNLKAFANAYGSPNTFSHFSSCPITYDVVLEQVYGTTKLRRDYVNAKYVVNFGHNLFEGIDIALSKPLMKFVQKSDTKFLVLDPRFSVIASKADEWLPIKPGTDLAFILAIMNVWVKEDKYDKEFIQNYTIGFDKIKEFLLDKTPQWAERITTIKADDIIRIANEIYKCAPRVIIDWGHKTTTTHAEYMKTKAIAIANAMMGNFEQIGGIGFVHNAKFYNNLVDEKIFPTLNNPYSKIQTPKVPRMDKTNKGEAYMFAPKGHGILLEIAPAIFEQKPYPIKGWVATRHNPVMNVAGMDNTIKAIKELEFVMAIDIYVSDFSYLADVIFPEATYLERDEAIMDKSGLTPAYYTRNKAVEPIGDTLNNYEIFAKLAKMLGIEQDYKWSNIDDFRHQQVNGDTKLLLNLIRDGFVKFDTIPVHLRDKKSVKDFTDYYPKAKSKVLEDGTLALNFATKSKKIELFSEEVEEYFPNFGGLGIEGMDVFGEYPLVLTNGKTAIHTNAHTQNIEILNNLFDDSGIWIHPNTAKKRGLVNNDEVIVYNKFASMKGNLFVTEGIREDTLFVYHGFGHISKDLKRTYGHGSAESRILSPLPGYICGTMVTNVGVDIKKA